VSINQLSNQALAADKSESFLQIKRIVKKFDDVFAVDEVSIDIEQGEIFALLGSSGCGKSTLLRMLGGFETPTSGEIILAGKTILALAPYERPINMMFQNYALFPHLSVWDNIAFGLRRDGMPKKEVNEHVQQMLDLVKLGKFAKRKPHQLSGGQQQRVALARSLAKRPKLLLLDEPLGALDAKLREQTQLELVSILKTVGVTCVMVTHDQKEAMTMANRIAIMSEGKILQVGRPEEIYETPNCHFVADFIGEVNIFDGKLVVDESDHVKIKTPEGMLFVPHGITGALGMDVQVAIRPEKIMIETDKPKILEDDHPEEAGCNQMMGVVENVAYLGDSTTFHVIVETGMKIRISNTNSGRKNNTKFQVGAKVCVWWCGADAVILTQ
jgi:putrescine transport system ATP-binding protein